MPEEPADRWQEIERFKQEGRIDEALALLRLEAQDQEVEAAEEGWDVAPGAFMELALLYRQRKDHASEVAVLERLAAGSTHRPDARRDLLLEEARARAAAGPEPAPACPHCGAALDPPPTRSRKCPRCAQRITTRTDSVLGRRVLLTPHGAKASDAEKEQRANRTRLLRRVGKIGLGMAEFNAVVDALRAQHGIEPDLGDAFWRLAYEEKSRQCSAKDWLALSRTCREMAAYLHDQGRESLELLREAAQTELRSLAADPFTNGIEIIAHRPCASCGRDDARQFTVADAQAANPLPHPDCDTGFCQCWYRSVRTEGTVTVNTPAGVLRIRLAYSDGAV